MIDYLRKFRLDGKVAVVCGGFGLIGKEVSLALTQAGAKVYVLDINKFEWMDGINFIEFDITNFDNYDDVFATIINEAGKIDICVNLAYPRTSDWGGPLEDVLVSSWKKNIDMHLNSYCLVTRAVAEIMKKQGIKGSIINFGSIYGVVGPDFEVYSGTSMTNEGQYAAIKGGIINFSRFTASYYGKYGIRVNCLCPGGVFDNQNEIFVKNYGLRTPLRRMANADEIASATLFLASDASSYITGSTFMVDGGWTCI